jgi:O-antigen ligase
MDISLRRGATHSLLTDLLVVYGLCGCIIYFMLMISIIWFLWRLYRHPDSDETARMTTLACLLLLVFNFVYGIVGGAPFQITVTWLLIALFGYLYGCAKKNAAKEVHVRNLPLRRGRMALQTPVPVLSSGRRPAFGRFPNS